MQDEVRSIRQLGSLCSLEHAVYVGAAGFEPRAPGTLQSLMDNAHTLEAAVLLVYDGDRRIPENEQNLAHMSCLAARLAGPDMVADLMVSEVHLLQEVIGTLGLDGKDLTFLVDVTAMSHFLMFRALRYASMLGSRYVVLYTEAEKYRPFREDVEQALAAERDSEGFMTLTKSEYEQEEIMFAGDYKTVHVPEFAGDISPSCQARS